MQTCVGGRVVTQPRKERQSFRFKSKTSRHPLSMDELIALIDSATGHLGGDARGHERVPGTTTTAAIPSTSSSS